MILKYDSNGDGTANQSISNIITYPEITTRLDQVGHCTFSIIDRLGALYSTWEALDNIKFLIEDDSSNVIFSGYVIDKRFKHNTITVIAKGIGAILEWKHFKENYILAEGTVKTIPATDGEYDIETTLDPSSDAVPNEWGLSAPAGNYAYLADGSDGTAIGAVSAEDSGDVEEFGFPNTITDVNEVTQVVVHIRGERIDNGDGIGQGSVAINLGGWEASKPTTFGAAGITETTYTWAGLHGSQANMDAFEVRITAPNPLAGIDIFSVAKMWVVVTHDTLIYSIELEEDTEDDNKLLNWSADQWTENRDVGLLITDNTSALNSNVWKCQDADITVSNVDSETGDCDSTLTAHDGDDHTCVDNSSGTMYAEYDIDSGDNVATTKILDRIEVFFHVGTAAVVGAHFSLWLKKDTTWVKYRNIYCNLFGPSVFSDTIVLYDDLEDFLEEAGGNYTGFKGIKVQSWTAWDNIHNFNTDELTVTLYYADVSIDPIMEKIDSNGDEWVNCTGIEWSTSGVVDRDGDDAGDYWKIGQCTTKIVGDVSGKLVNVDGSGLSGIEITSTLSKYIARNYRGVYCMEVLKNVCALEGVHWWEDYANNQIVIAHEDDFADSTENFTNADLDYEWEIHDEANDISRVDVYGNASLFIHETAVSSTCTGPREWVHIDEKIMTAGDAGDLAASILAEKEVKQTQFKMTLQGLNANLTVGTTVDIDIDNPNIDATFPISKIVRKKGAYVGSDDIWTEVYCGMGHTTPQEKIIDRLNDVREEARRAATDRLSTTAFSSAGTLDWSDIGGVVAGVESVIADTYATTQHYRLINQQIVPEQGETSGANNVYWNDKDYIAHGSNSLSSNNYASTWLQVPDDYVDGEDIIYNVWVRHPGAGAETIDHRFLLAYAASGSTTTTIQDDSSTWNLTADTFNVKQFTGDGTNVVAGMVLFLRWYMEDDDAVDLIRLIRITCEVPVNTRD